MVLCDVHPTWLEVCLFPRDQYVALFHTSRRRMSLEHGFCFDVRSVRGSCQRKQSNRRTVLDFMMSRLLFFYLFFFRVGVGRVSGSASGADVPFWLMEEALAADTPQRCSNQELEYRTISD